METGLSGLDEVEPPGDGSSDAFRAALSTPRPERLLVAAQALRSGLSIQEIDGATKFDPWFIRELARVVDAERVLTASGLPADAGGLRRLKALGFSDKRLGQLTGKTEAAVAAERERLGVLPVYKRIDTCAARVRLRHTLRVFHH